MKKSFVVSAIIVIIAVVAISLLGTSFFSEPSVNIDDSKPNDSRIIDWRHVHGVGIDPVDTSILYIATHGDFYQSISDAPPIKVDKVRADYMAFNAPPVPGVSLYASGHPSTGGNTGLIKSNDGGVTWIHLDAYQELSVFALAFDDQGKLFASVKTFGIVQSDDFGKSWDSLQHVDLTVTSIAADSQNKEIYVGGFSSGGFQEVYKINYDATDYMMIGTNKGLR